MENNRLEKRLQIALEVNRMTSMELAQKAGITEDIFDDNAVYEPTPDDFGRILDVLHLPAEYFFMEMSEDEGEEEAMARALAMYLPLDDSMKQQVLDTLGGEDED